MPAWLRHLTTWLVAASKNGGLWWGLAVSVGLGVGSLGVALAVVTSWPADRFKLGGRAVRATPRHAAVRALATFGKNLAGVVLVLLGAVMALPGVPGQGLLTMIIGLTLVDFPGKLTLERRLVSRPFVLRQLNALRARFRRPPLALGDEAAIAAAGPRPAA